MLLEFSKRKIEILDAENKAKEQNAPYHTIVPEQSPTYYYSYEPEQHTHSQEQHTHSNAFASYAPHPHQQPIIEPLPETHPANASFEDAGDKQQHMHYLEGYEAKISELSAALAQQISYIHELSDAFLEDETTFHAPIPVREEMTALINASLKSADVVSIFQDMAQKINLFALRAILKANDVGEHRGEFRTLALELKHLAEQTSQSAQMLTANMSTVQNTLNKVSLSVLKQQKLNSLSEDVAHILKNFECQPHHSEDSCYAAEMTHIHGASEDVSNCSHDHIHLEPEVSHLPAPQSEVQNFAQQLQLSLNEMKSGLGKIA